MPSYSDIINGQLSDATADVVIEEQDLDSDLDVPRRECTPPPAYTSPRRAASPEVMADVERYSPRAYSPTMPPYSPTAPTRRGGYRPETSPVSSAAPSRADSPASMPSLSQSSSSSEDSTVERAAAAAAAAAIAVTTMPEDADLFDPCKAAGFRNTVGEWRLHLGYRRVLRRRKMWFGCALCLRLFKTRRAVKQHFSRAHVYLDASRDVDTPECPECDSCYRCAPPRV